MRYFRFTLLPLAGLSSGGSDAAGHFLSKLRCGLRGSSSLAVVIRAELPDRNVPAPEHALKLLETEGFNDCGPSMAEMRKARPPVGYRSRSPRERLLFLAGFALLVGGNVLSHRVNQGVGLGLELVGLIIVVTIAARLFIYRDDKTKS